MSETRPSAHHRTLFDSVRPPVPSRTLTRRAAGRLPTSAYPYAHGGAWYDGHPGWRAFGIRVGGIQKLAGKTVTVTVHGAVVGRMRVSQYGTAHLYRRAGMPRCGGGDVVRVGNRAGTLVTYGTMRHRYHRMM